MHCGICNYELLIHNRQNRQYFEVFVLQGLIQDILGIQKHQIFGMLHYKLFSILRLYLLPIEIGLFVISKDRVTLRDHIMIYS